MRKLQAIWLFIFFLVGCGQNPATPAAPSPEPTASPLPATPVINPFIPWTADQADQLIQDLRQADQMHPGSEPTIHQALLLAVEEALWRFPQAQQTTAWRWLHASIQAGDGNRAAAQTYADLIAAALQSEDVLTEDLSTWLGAMEPDGVLTQTLQTALPGQEFRALLEFRLVGQPAYIWLTQQAGEFQISLLASGREFQVGSSVQTRLEWHDLTGDGQAEAWIIHTDSNRRIEMASLIIYDLASGSAQRLYFSPALPMLPSGSWQILEENGRAVGLQAGLRVDDGSALCEYLLPVEYRLEGSVYRRTAIEQPDLDGLVAAGFSEAQARLCLDLSVDLLRANASGDDLLSLQILEGLMPGFPYGADATLYVGLYPPDEIDRARFELGLNYARRGDLAGVQRWMSELIARPAFEGSPWQKQAQAFLEAYQEETDLRRACLASHACLGTGRLSLNQLVGLMQPEDWSDSIAFLGQNGLALQQSGPEDFNQDGTIETWWLESTSGATDTLSILARLPDQPWLSRLNLPAGTGELTMQSLDALLGLPVYRVQRGSEAMVFLYVQQEPTQAPAVWTLEQYRAHVVQSLYQSLLRGGDVAEIIQSLQALQASPYFNCAQPTEICQPSAQQAYLAALSLDRAGDARAAEAYQLVEESFPESSYAILAHARLAPQ